ncbi:MAG: Kazal-type serine protease inhibitor domain-containing protein [Candidatus Paceibacterota bacterium]|jgi:hypothetical protein
MNKRYFLVALCLFVAFSCMGLALAADNQPAKTGLFQSIINLLTNKGKATVSDPLPTFKTSPCGSYGDINSDGKITIDDVNLGYEQIDNNTSFLSKIDVDGSGFAGFNDVVMINDYLTGKISTFTACQVGSVKVTCTDSDGGKVYNTKGNVKWGPIGGTVDGKYEEKADVCTDDKVLLEQYCKSNPDCVDGICSHQTVNADSVPVTETYACLNGCKDGACLDTLVLTKDYSRFSVTELIEDNLPESITFWTSALCPTASRFAYAIPEGYTVASCESGPTGSHGGCSFCAMSKIKLVQDSYSNICAKEDEILPAHGSNISCCSGLTRCIVTAEIGNVGMCKKSCDTIPTIKIISPVQGDQLIVGQSYTIKWTSLNYSLKVNILLDGYDEKGGKIESGYGYIASAIDNNNFYQWTPTVNDLSYFVSTPAKYRIRITPAGGTVGSLAGASGMFNISTASYKCINENQSIPVTPIGLTCCSGLTLCPASAGTVGSRGTCKKSCTTIPSITILSPAQDETVSPGSKYTIKWKGENLKGDTIYIHGNKSSLITTLPASATSYVWTVPQEYAGSKATIWVESLVAGQSAWEAYSYSYFNVGKTTSTDNSLKVLSPNGEEYWLRGSTHDITWNSSGLDTVTIALIDYRAGPVETIIAYNVSASLGKYSWTIPQIITPGNTAFKIAIRGKAIEDLSDNYFSIISSESSPSLNSSLYNTPPSSNIAPGSLKVPFLKFKMVATGDDFKLTTVEVTKVGGSYGDISSVELSAGGTGVWTTPVSSSSGKYIFHLPLVIAKGTQTILDVRANVSPEATIGERIAFKVSLIEAISSSSEYNVGWLNETGDPMIIGLNQSACPKVFDYNPICGVNGKTYLSECDALAAGTTKSSDGACKTKTETTPKNLPTPDKPLNQMNREELINFLIKLIQILLINNTSNINQ